MLVAGLLVALSVPLQSAAAQAPATGTWFDGLEAGICFDDAFTDDGDWDFGVPALLVSCDGPHGNEVVARLSLGNGEHRGEAMIQAIDDRCATEYEDFLGRAIERTLLLPFNVGPSDVDWAAGAHDAVCVVYTGEPLIGTAASGSLRAPGETIAAYREVDQEPDIWLIDAGTGEALQNVTDNGLNEVITSPAWTPDGASIAFALEASGSGEQTDIFLVSVEDGTTVPLVETAADEDGAVFSPDGSTIAYISDADATEFEIYKQDLATGETTRLTTYADRDSSPQWSPDGTKLAFRRRADDVSDIWTMDIDGGDLQRLTDNGGNNYDPRWSPDGSRIAFTTNQAGNFDIGVMNSDGTEQALLTSHPADDEFPTWSSDGTVLAFHSTRHSGVSLWLMRSDGSDQSELTGLAPVGFSMFAPAARE